MTRQEQINNASNQLSESFKCSKAFKMGFEAGAMWADENPKSPWISVKNDLPYYHEYLLDTDISTKEVLVILKYKEDPTLREVQFCKMFNHKNMGTFNDRWYWNSPRYYTVTHWMPIPDIYLLNNE